MPNLTISVNHRRAFGPPRPRHAGLKWLKEFLAAISSGDRQGDCVAVAYSDSIAVGNDATLGPACGALVGSTLSGSVGGTIGGTLVTVTAAGGDTATQTALAAAIRNNTTVNRFITASNQTMQLSLATVLAGTTVQICGQTFTAVGSAGAVTQFGHFDISGTDTQDAASLALAINRHPTLAGRIRAVSNVGAVYIALLDLSRPASAFDCIQAPSAATITIQRGTPIAGPITVLAAQFGQWGPIGNFCTVVASGTGMTYATNGAAGQMGGGTGGGNTVAYSSSNAAAAFTLVP